MTNSRQVPPSAAPAAHGAFAERALPRRAASQAKSPPPAGAARTHDEWFFSSTQQEQARAFLAQRFPLTLRHLPRLLRAKPTEPAPCHTEHDTTPHGPLGRTPGRYCFEHDTMLINEAEEAKAARHNAGAFFRGIVVHEWAHAAQAQTFGAEVQRFEAARHTVARTCREADVSGFVRPQAAPQSWLIWLRPKQASCLQALEQYVGLQVLLEGSAEYVREVYQHEVAQLPLNKVRLPVRQGDLAGMPYQAGVALFHAVARAAEAYPTEIDAASGGPRPETLLACAWQTVFAQPQHMFALLPHYGSDSATQAVRPDEHAIAQLIAECAQPLRLSGRQGPLASPTPLLGAPARTNVSPLLFALPLLVLAYALLRTATARAKSTRA